MSESQWGSSVLSHGCRWNILIFFTSCCLGFIFVSAQRLLLALHSEITPSGVQLYPEWNRELG